MPTIAEHWRAEGTRFWWRVDPPAGLAVQSDEGRSAVVRFDAMDLDAIDFVQSAGELDERKAGLSDHSSTIDYLNELIRNPDPQLTWPGSPEGGHLRRAIRPFGLRGQ
ncbi:hypothetical protein [Kutzneria sp. 744]|jgi:hypothetical protein|uniref:hypothetical protein n=1 Tax=Kutzneria sp. (strain 744) TaxID=345341 RepID=UPI0003EEDD19|nr:hypothetical protein [Kutzneria sp. 744]EWM11317.1 hypothetical protein KUTG_01621 [Kutzneria sp. 744]